MGMAQDIAPDLLCQLFAGHNTSENVQKTRAKGDALAFRLEIFNAAQFSNPDVKLLDGAFGQITTTKIANGDFEVALKYPF
jgi:hypothetical protein